MERALGATMSGMGRLVAAVSIAIAIAAAGAGNVSSLQAPASPSSTQPDVDSTALPPRNTIISGFIERAERQDEAEPELGYESRIVTTTDTLNGDGEITKTERTVHRRYPIENQIYEELIGRNGQPLSQQEREDELDKREEFLREARERTQRGDGPVETNDERQILLGDLMNRFEASVVGVETIDDEPCWVLDFTPREGALPEKTRIDRALNRSSGRLYIARRDYGLRRVEFRMNRSVRYFWGLARLRRATGRLDFERVEPDVWLPSRYDFELDLRVFFSSRRQQIEREWVERRRLPSPAD